MASSRGYLDFILEQLFELEEITYRAMMGEYILYYRGKIVGGIYDDRLLVKPVKSAISLMPDAFCVVLKALEAHYEARGIEELNALICLVKGQIESSSNQLANSITELDRFLLDSK